MHLNNLNLYIVMDNKKLINKKKIIIIILIKCLVVKFYLNLHYYKSNKITYIFYSKQVIILIYNKTY